MQSDTTENLTIIGLVFYPVSVSKMLTYILIKYRFFPQLDEIEKLGESFEVQVELNRKLGKVRLQGIATDVFNAADAVHSILLNVHQYVQEAQKAELLAGFVQWSFIETDISGNSDQIPYEKMNNQLIENAYQSHENILHIKDGSECDVVIDFTKMVQLPYDVPGTMCTVVRKDCIQGGFVQS